MVFAGAEHPRLRLPAYGGRLFDPDRFPYLKGRKAGSSFRDTPARPLAVDNLTVLHLLESLQKLKIRHSVGVMESRRLGFRSLDIEQIGHVYEGLLDHTMKRSTGLVIGMSGKKGKEPEVSVDELDRLRATSEDAVVHYLSDVAGEKEERIKGKFTYSLPKQDASRLLLLCERREEWFERIRQYGGFLRKDTFDRPVIVPPDAIYMTEGTDRRTSGTHYTPRSLTEPIVRHTLEPMVYEGPRESRPPDEWALVPPARILSLKVADTAMGSGAFLVQACRYLADRLVESWEEAVMAHGTGSGITPEGAPSTGAKGERLIPEDTEERLVYARRLIAERCLFGVDKNPMAVEMAKLSLWLITLDKHRPFTFLDHAVKAGDSLLGITDITQIIYFHPDPARGKDLTPDLFALKFQIAEAVERARIKRVELESFTEWTIEDARRKERLHEEAILAVEEVRIIADCQCAAIFESAGQSDEALDERLKGYARDLVAALQVEPGSARRRESFDRLGVWARDALNAGRPPGTPERRPFHWAVEFPEIFKGPGDGFDTIVGNPPFQGGQKLTGALGQSYREHLVHHLADGQRGSADLCAYFFLRNYDLLAPSGNFGLIATNTIAQGDTREVGLDQLRERSATIYRATPSRKWPGDANLEVAEVWLTRGTWAGASALGDKLVPGITAYLAVPGKAVGKPYRLAANAGKSFQGSIVLGMGFVLTPEEAEALIEKDPRNRDCLFPYLNGKDLNSRPDQSPSRWVINFFDWPLEKAESYPDLIQIVREKVKPERDRNNRKVYRDRWWHYAEKRPALYEAIAGMERVLSLSLVNNHLGIGRVLTGTVFAHKLAVFPLDGGAIFGILQSSFHYKWAWEHSSTMRLDINYSPSDCFDTFPFPHLSGSPHATAIDQIGETYHEHRRQLMLERQEGLTSTYNRFHNPTEASADIARLRSLHVEMDQAVAAAYGWTDLDLGHDFHQTKQGLRFTISEPARQEVLDRLLELNYARYAEEVKQGLHSKAGKAKKASRKRGAGTKKAGAAVGSGKGKKGTKDQGRLF